MTAEPNSATKMPPEVAETFDLIRQHLFLIHDEWQDFCSLFLPNSDDPTAIEQRQKDITLLGSLASDFFAVCQDLLVHDVIMSLCRLTDRAEYGGEENVTIARLSNLVAAAGNTQLSTRLGEESEKVAHERKTLSKYRNKRLGHNDLKVACNAALLDDIPRRTIEAVLDGIETFMNVLANHYDEQTFVFHACGVRDGADALLHRLWRLLPEGTWRLDEGISPTTLPSSA